MKFRLKSSLGYSSTLLWQGSALIMLQRGSSTLQLQYPSMSTWLHHQITTNLICYTDISKISSIFSHLDIFTPPTSLPTTDTPLSTKIMLESHFQFFNDCIGAIDGTHIRVFVAVKEHLNMWNRKGFLSQNCLFVCNFELLFTYICSDGVGWHNGRCYDVAWGTAMYQRHLQVVEGLWEAAQPGQYHLYCSRNPLNDVENRYFQYSLSGCCGMRWQCKSSFYWSIWSPDTAPTWCWRRLECRHGGFSYDTSLSLAAQLQYTPKRVPIKLADNTVVYSAGVGFVVFHPNLEGKRGRAVEFSNILHVPHLRNNLLTVLYLTRHSSFVVQINATHMSLAQSSGPPLFVAPINDHNAAFLDGVTEPITEFANPATTLPLDLLLWHQRLAHHNLTDVKVLIEHNLVTGMQLDVKTAPDPICEPCLAGKMHTNPFPSSSWRTFRPLELVHSDVHKVPYRSFSEFCYWVTFIDDYLRYRFVLPIHAKSDVFATFKQFKAFAENQTERKIKTLRDDKGGEYMSNAMLEFTNSCGIERQHTVRVHPQQNGVAERANRVLSEHIMAMLKESGLAMAFWGEALAALIHVCNRCPIAALDNAKPYELWNVCKLDVSHLQVWSCTAYVHV